jgi:hypothetical protein
MDSHKVHSRFARFAMLFVVMVCGSMLYLLEGRSFVREGSGSTLFFWPRAQATLNLRLGCPSTALLHWGPCWDDAAVDAAERWNSVTSQFRFVRRSASTGANPCKNDGLNTVAFRSTMCGKSFGDAIAATVLVFNSSTGALIDTDTVFNSEVPRSTYPGPLQRGAFGRRTIHDLHRVAIHEFGHVLGLDHPNDFGQSVVAIMNSRVSDLEELQPDDIAGANSVYRPTNGPLPSLGVIENPPAGRVISGISLISGWVCTASRVDVVIDGRVVPASYGTPRTDTRGVCGDDNNGYGLLFNWNLLGNGTHTLIARADGVEFARVTFSVVTFGLEFLRGAGGRFTVPFANRTVTVEWQESSQSFVIVGVQ